ncbi:hypothetical protein [Tardiphaga sp. OK246]|jgi:hypothetical protein|uniref:hypothetical protein n=1 Tax=Tardiphaga sp. OK246 TaxID=1855307 RepID=UPI0015961B6C|nr:hypothetical protein [Tardiphaga sp. OK246]
MVLSFLGRLLWPLDVIARSEGDAAIQKPRAEEDWIVSPNELASPIRQGSQ